MRKFWKRSDKDKILLTNLMIRIYGTVVSLDQAALVMYDHGWSISKTRKVLKKYPERSNNRYMIA